MKIRKLKQREYVSDVKWGVNSMKRK